MTTVQALGVSSCLGGSMRSCGYAAEMLRYEFDRHLIGPRLNIQWHFVYPQQQSPKEARIFRINQSISHFTRFMAEQNKPFLVVGGDHSCAMGTWVGVMNGLKQAGQFGLIWLDAHMDAHTFLTSPSGNIHGMPLAALLGKADAKLAAMYPGDKFIKPENLILIGVRSYEKEEHVLLKQAKVQVICAKQITDLGQTLLNAVNQLSKSCRIIGISIDMDCIDPEDAPGVETPAKGGLKVEDLMTALALVNNHKKLCGLEICEFTPEKDINNKTLRLMKVMVETFYARYMENPQSQPLNKVA